MKVTNIQLRSTDSSEFSFGLSENSQSDKYLAKTMLGLDADALVPKFYGFGKRTRQPFYIFTREKREIVMRIVLNPNFSINESYADIRDELYRAISSGRGGSINLLLTAGGAAISTINGFITKFEVPHFSKVPELQLTITCNDPMFRGIAPIEYEQPDLSTSSPIFIGDSLSTAPHGFKFQLEFTDDVPSFTIQDEATDPDWLFTVQPDGGFLSGDILTFSSEFKDKYLYIERDSVVIPILNDIVAGSIWPIIFQGSNQFYFLEIDDFDWVSLSYYPAYWGV